MSQRPIVWISKRTLVTLGLLALVVIAGLIALLPRQNADAAMVDPAKRVARGLATQDIYLRPDEYKSDLTWAAYQQLLAVAPPYQQQNAREPFNSAFVKYGSVVLLDQGFFGDSVTALVQVVLNQNNTPTLVELQLQMLPDGSAWKVGPIVTTLVKGEVKLAR